MKDKKEIQKPEDIKKPTFAEEIIKCPFPLTEVTYTNTGMGSLDVGEIKVMLKNPRDWENMPFVLKRLFPFLIPDYSKHPFKQK